MNRLTALARDVTGAFPALFGMLIAVLVFDLGGCPRQHGMAAPPAPGLNDSRPAAVKALRIPSEAQAYRAELIRNARAVWGLDAPSAVFAAQIHQESGWKPGAKSSVGAQGMAQFMPATAAWIADVHGELGEAAPMNPSWAMRAMVTYDRYLWDRVSAADSCHRMAMALSGYNGGLGWVNRDKRLAAQKGLDPTQWWDHVETVNAGRSAANFRENRGYPQRILKTLAPAYVSDGWGQGVCL